MSDHQPQLHRDMDISIPSMDEAYKFLHIVPNPNGSLTRPNAFPTLPAQPNSADPQAPALSKDITLNPKTGTFIRLFRPRNPPQSAKLPLILYFHGGGFILLSATNSVFHESCSRMAAEFPAVIASVEYRLAPENRLPAAYDDAVDALMWAKSQAGGGDAAVSEPWMRELADFSRVFLMGSSAGGNMVYHVGLRALDLELQPLKIVGLVMNQPFFGGPRRTRAEIEHVNDRIAPLHVADLMWSLALPEGADRGHKYCDPEAAVKAEAARLPACVVRGYAGDPFVERQKELAELLEARGVHVTKQFLDGGHHAVELVDPKFAELLYNDFKDFVCSH